MSNIPSAPSGAIRLKIDAVTLRQQLRYAFAHAFAVIQELIQNARRAGASRVLVEYDEKSKTLIVDDDGCGIADFQTLLTFAASGWDEEVASAERPYGMGFLSSLYASSRVEIVSRGQRLVFDTAGILADEGFTLEPAVERPGTRIVLHGVDLRDAEQTMQRIAYGYTIRIVFNGRELTRPDAPDVGEFVQTDIGLARIARTYGAGRTVVYLQGFRVFEPDRRWGHLDNVVHLDPAKFRGVFPDRDRCIDEREMLIAVETTIKQLYTDRLLAQKAELPSAEFCRRSYELARSLERIDVFNDVDALPGEWLATPDELPRSRYEGEDVALKYCERDFTRAEIESGAIELVELEVCSGFAALDDGLEDGRTQLLWMYAYAASAHGLATWLDEGHWIHAILASNEPDVTIDAKTLHEGRVPWERAIEVGRCPVQLCESVRLCRGERNAEVLEAFAMRRDSDTVFVVPCEVGRDGATNPAVVGWDALRQGASYIDSSDDLDEHALDVDAQEVNQTVRAMLAKSPIDHLQMLLDVALRDYRPELKRFASVTLTVNDAGSVTVRAAEQAAAVPA
jgi:hypothetical protein